MNLSVQYSYLHPHINNLIIMNKSKTKTSKKATKQPSRNITRRPTTPKSFAIYYVDSNKDIKYVRFRTIQNKDESIKITLTFVNKFKDASMFINSDSVKKHISLIQPKYPLYNFKYIDSTKI